MRRWPGFLAALTGNSHMDLTSFKKNAPGRLVEAFEGGVTFHAYIPDPLPPKLKLNPALIIALSGADRALGELAGLGHTITNPQLLIRPFVRREAVLSSRIEGTRTDLTALYAYEAGQLSLPGLSDETTSSDAREVLNYVRALEYGLERLTTDPLGLHLIREVHACLLEGVRGEATKPGQFRTQQNYIGSGPLTLAEARFVPPPALEVWPLLRDLEGYMRAQDDLPPLLRLALIHYQFEAIHPFADGNGRVGRLLITLLLMHWNLLPLPLLYLSAFFEKHRDTYNDLLLAVSQRAAWDEWLQFFLRGVDEQARDAIERAKQLQDLRAKWLSQVHKKGFPGLLARIVEYLFVNPIVTATEIGQQLDVYHSTAMRNLRRLADSGIVYEVQGIGRDYHFVALQILQLLS
jgi:Fic family protein